MHIRSIDFSFSPVSMTNSCNRIGLLGTSSFLKLDPDDCSIQYLETVLGKLHPQMPYFGNMILWRQVFQVDTYPRLPADRLGVHQQGWRGGDDRGCMERTRSGQERNQEEEWSLWITASTWQDWIIPKPGSKTMPHSNMTSSFPPKVFATSIAGSASCPPSHNTLARSPEAPKGSVCPGVHIGLALSWAHRQCRRDCWFHWTFPGQQLYLWWNF